MAIHATQRHSSPTPRERYRYVPQAPPSPPMEETRCSLPSISKLLGIADAGSPTSLASPDSFSESSRTEGSSALRRQETPFASFESRPNSSYAQHLHQSKSLPPTPPLGSDSSFETRSSPSTNSSRHCSLALYPGGRVLEATPPPDARRFQLPHPAANQPQGNAQAANLQQLSAPLGMVQGQPTAASYFHPALPATAATHPQISNLYYQQPMPHAFPPMAAPLAFPASGNNPWQHHHYLNPVHGMAYPQSQDRYICPTCSKAFSRPSSLRIHSHSHTGEKPFKCPHAGCGKAFSVRSNMKRHERGCHTFMVNSNQSL